MKKPHAWLCFIATALAVASTTSCAYDIQSPVPKGTSAEPDLVCNAKPVTEDFSVVALHGENFTPMPSKTLEDKPQLILPKIELTQTQSFDGTALEKKAVLIKDDPAKPTESRVHWTSEKLMSFDVLPEDKLLTGVFSVKITNPDGKSAATITKGLAVLPAPVISTIVPPTICDDQADQQITLTGKYFLSYEGHTPTVTVGTGASEKTYTATVDEKSCTALDGNFTEKNVKLCTSMTITIKQGDFPVTVETKLPVVVTNPAPADCASSETIEITIEPPPRVDAVVPAMVCEGGSTVTISGEGFRQGATVSMTCGTAAPVDASNVQVSQDGKSISATFGLGATAGESCDVTVKNPDGCEDRPTPHKTVTVVSGPIVFYVDPPVVYNGINTRITIFATAITTPLPADAVTIVPHGQTAPVTQLTWNAVPNHPNRVQAVVPTNQAAGVYDLKLQDGSPCPAMLPNAITVTSNLTVTLQGVVPPFGWVNEDTAIMITAAQPFQARPRVFLNPTNPAATDIAVEVESVAVSTSGTGNTATGVVPAGTPVHGYDLVLVNPDGSVGVLQNAYTEVQTAPPVVNTATPSSIVAASGEKVTLAGTGFAAGDTVTASCESGAKPSVTVSTAPSCTGTACTMGITIDGGALSAGDVCILRVTASDGSYGEYSAIGVTTSSLNLSSPVAGSPMTVGRRALAAAAGKATTTARFVYAIGGDNGAAAGAFDSVEYAPVDIYGKIGTWAVQPNALKAKRTLAGTATLGRYVYLIGGDDGAGPVSTAERALILSPRETPVINDVDLALVKTGGLDAGEYAYRVAAVFDANDTDNPGGESLASDPFTIKLPAFPNRKINVTLVWKAPVDSLGNAVPGVVGYRIYRTAVNGAAGSETLLKAITGTQLTFTDDGSAAPGTETPLPLGTTGQWAQLPALGTKRSGPAVAAGVDPTDPNKFYVYAFLGKSGATTAVASYEFLSVTIAPNGRQSVGTAWTAGASSSAVARWQAGAWVADKTVQSNYAPDTWIFIGGGLLGNDSLDGTVEAAKINAGGDLGTISNTPGDFSSSQAGYGVCAANQQLFLFGGGSPSAAPAKSAKSAALYTNSGMLAPPTLANNAWNNEGLSMTHGRYLLGSAVQSSFIFLLGGQTDEPSAASKTTEYVIW